MGVGVREKGLFYSVFEALPFFRVFFSLCVFLFSCSSGREPILSANHTRIYLQEKISIKKYPQTVLIVIFCAIFFLPYLERLKKKKTPPSSPTNQHSGFCLSDILPSNRLFSTKISKKRYSFGMLKKIGKLFERSVWSALKRVAFSLLLVFALFFGSQGFGSLYQIPLLLFLCPSKKRRFLRRKKYNEKKKTFHFFILSLSLSPTPKLTLQRGKKFKQ